jgi:hypothetical protein
MFGDEDIDTAGEILRCEGVRGYWWWKEVGPDTVHDGLVGVLDAANRLTSALQKNSGGTQIASYSYGFDAAGNKIHSGGPSRRWIHICQGQPD